MPRYKRTRKFRNNLEYYDFLTKKRGIRIANHYATPILKNPSVAERTRIITDKHIWSLGDRYYKLADKYYGDPTYWWVIAWYNSAPTEVDLEFGDLLEIPININTVLDVLGLDY